MYCPNCGKQTNEAANFCRACGYDLKDEKLEQPQPIKEAKGIKQKPLKMAGKSSKKRKGWFQRHPSYVILLYSTVLWPVTFIFPSMFPSEVSTVLFITATIVGWVICYRALRLKNRSPLWLLLMLLQPFAALLVGSFVPFLYLLFCNWLEWLFIMILVRNETRFLTKEQIKAGLYIEKERGFLNLMRNDEFLTTFPIQGTTKKAIRERAQEYV